MITGWIPNRKQSLDIHEICRKSQAPVYRWADRCNYLLLGRAAHESPLIATSNRASHIVQLAIKRLADPEHFDLERWLEIRNPKAMDYITIEEIEQVDLSLWIPGYGSSVDDSE